MEFCSRPPFPDGRVDADKLGTGYGGSVFAIAGISQFRIIIRRTWVYAFLQEICCVRSGVGLFEEFGEALEVLTKFAEFAGDDGDFGF